MNVHPFAFSGLKAYETCQRQYYEVRVLRKWPSPTTEANIYGERLHKAAELYVANDEPLGPEFEFLRPLLDRLKAIPGTKYTERRMAVKSDLTPCDWKDPEAWFRGVADIAVVDEDAGVAYVADYKSGSNRYPDLDQLDLMALLLMAHHPKVQRVKCALLFVAKNSISKKTVSRNEADRLWEHYRARDQKRVASHVTGVFNPKQSGLCKKHCPCVDCEFNGM